MAELFPEGNLENAVRYQPSAFEKAEAAPLGI
jgi:hypothetical protein